MPANIRKVLKKLKKELLRIYGGSVDSIILYGSRARGVRETIQTLIFWLY
jgi:predicted nucleotidyltransferase